MCLIASPPGQAVILRHIYRALLDGWELSLRTTESMVADRPMHTLRMVMPSMGWDTCVVSADAAALAGMALQEQARLLADTLPDEWMHWAKGVARQRYGPHPNRDGAPQPWYDRGRLQPVGH